MKQDQNIITERQNMVIMSAALRFAMFSGEVLLLTLIVGTLFTLNTFLSYVLDTSSIFIPVYSIALTASFISSVLSFIALTFGMLKLIRKNMNQRGKFKLLIVAFLNFGFSAATFTLYQFLSIDLFNALSVVLLTLLGLSIIYKLSSLYLELIR
ncbi:hypothetical protein [Lactobacillus taiwanensis]|uniref:hypothetical protein n=1 Tax=Lactobacillus taiwanensis TaxID=508451 RepID=UPI00321FE179